MRPVVACPLVPTLLVLALLAAVPAAADVPPSSAGGPGEPASSDPQPERVESGELVSFFGGEIRVPAGELREGPVTSVGGRVVVEGEITGEVVVIMGELVMRGARVGGPVTLVLTEGTIVGSAIDGELVNVLGPLEIRGTEIGQNFVNVMGDLDVEDTFPSTNIAFGRFGFQSAILWLRFAFKLLAFVLVVLLVALVPERVRRIGEVAPVRYVAAFFVGLLGWLALLALSTLLSVTLIGIPLAVLLVWVVKWLGMAGIFFAVGRRLGRSLGLEPSLLAGVVLGFVPYAALAVAPMFFGMIGTFFALLISFLFVVLLEIPAVGLVILTRGGRPRPLAAATPAAPAAPALSPPPPAV